MYLRVSKDEQSTESQWLALTEVAQRRGWAVVEAYEDAGVSGAEGRDKRPAFDRLLRDATQGRYDVLLAWSVDRLGRSLQHLVAFLGDLRACGVDLYVHQQQLDTSTPSGRMMFQLCGVFAEFERELIRARVSAGIARARARGKRLGRPRASAKLEERIRQLRSEGRGLGSIARELGCGSSLVQRVSRGAFPKTRAPADRGA